MKFLWTMHLRRVVGTNTEADYRSEMRLAKGGGAGWTESGSGRGYSYPSFKP